MKRTKHLLYALALSLLCFFSVSIHSEHAYAASDSSDFNIQNGVLKNYYGQGGNVIIPSNVMEIADKAFSGSYTINSLTIPRSVKAIGNEAFYGCSGMTSLTLNKGLTTIGDGAFKNCSGLSTITLPSTVTSIGNSAFEGCMSLKKITLSSVIRHIGTYAFSGCSNLTSISLPKSLHSIDEYAFYRCVRLKAITIPSSVTSIGSYAFAGCSSLCNTKIPANVKTFGNFIFQDTSKNLIIWAPKTSMAYEYANSYMIRFHKAMSLSKSTLTLAKGKTYQLKLSNSIAKQTWKSSKTSVATVSSTGKIKALKKGTTTISVTSSGQTFKCKVTVK